VITFPVFDGVALCAQVDPEVWFPEAGWEGQIVTAQAKKLCGRCDLQAACLQWAIDNDEAGIWGGTTERQRQRLPGRQVATPPTAEREIRHGTEGGYKTHRRRGEKPCDACNTGARAAEASRRARRTA